MNKNYKINWIWSFILGMTFISCGGGKSDSKPNPISQITITHTPQSITFPKKVLPIDLLAPTDIVVIDTFLLLMQHHEEEMIQAYSTNSLKFLNNFLRKGSGPNDVNMFGLTSQWFMEEGDPKLVVQSYPIYVGVLNIRKSVESDRPVFDRQYKFESQLGKQLLMASHSIYLLDSTQMAMTKDPAMSRVKDNNNYFWEFYDYKQDYVKRKFVYENFPMMDSFSKQSHRALKPDRTKMALFYELFDMVAIADFKTETVKQLLPETEELKKNRASDQKIRSVYYIGGECTDHYQFGLYIGKNAMEYELHEEENHSLIHIFDWEGNFLYKVDLEEDIKMIAVDSEQKYLYGVAASDSIYRYDLSVLPLK